MKFNDIYGTARPYIACFVILRRDNMIAMLRRKNTGWMDGCLALPAGKVEYGETYAEAAHREAMEEAGVNVDREALRFIHLAHRHGLEGKGFIDWVDVYFEADEWQGEPYNAEEHKSSELVWVDVQSFPDDVVPAQLAVLRALVDGEHYSEFGWSTESNH